ncbi:unnamed protein product [Closterium sp. NIES-53]
MLSPWAIRAWIVRRGNPGGGGYGPAGAGAASPGGTTCAGGAGGTAGGAAGAAGAGGAGATSPRGDTDAGGAGPTSPRGTAGAGRAGGAAGAGDARAGGTRGARGAGPEGARTGGAGAAGAGGDVRAGGATRAIGSGGAGGTAGAGGAGAAAVGAGGAAGAGGARGATRAAGTGGAGVTTDQSPPQLLPGSSLPAPAPQTEVTESLTKHREPETRASTPVRARSVARRRPFAVPGTHGMALRPSSVPQHVVLLEPPAFSLPHVTDTMSDLARAASPTVTRLLATVVTDLGLKSTATFALVTELVDFTARSRLDYDASLVTESESVCPPSVRGEPALSSDVLEDRHFELECLAAALPRFTSMLLCPEGDLDAFDIPTPCSYAEAIAGEYSSHWQIAMDTEMTSWKSTATYVDEVPPPGADIVDGMWIFKQQGVDFFHNFSPTPKVTTLRVLLHVATQRDYELHSLDFSTTFLQGSLHEEIWLRRPPGFTVSFPAGTQWSLRRPVYGLRQAPQEWHNTLRTTLAALGFAPSSADLSLFLRTDTTLPPFYVLVSISASASSSPRHSPLLCLPATRSQLHLWTSPTSDMGLVLGGRGSVVLTGHSDASWADDHATQRLSQGYTLSLGSGSVSWRSTRSSSVLGSRCEAKIYVGAMAAQELRWLTYLLTDLGEQPCSPPVVYVDNKGMLALCHEQRPEHRTKHIALHYFLARELQ